MLFTKLLFRIHHFDVLSEGRPTVFEKNWMPSVKLHHKFQWPDKYPELRELMLKINIFKVHGPSLYITDDNNVALFPAPDGHFSLLDLTVRGHYEVHGESISVECSPNTPVTPNPTRFSFQRPVSAAAGSATGSSAVPRATMPKTFQR